MQRRQRATLHPREEGTAFVSTAARQLRAPRGTTHQGRQSHDLRGAAPAPGPGRENGRSANFDRVRQQFDCGQFRRFVERLSPDQPEQVSPNS